MLRWTLHLEGEGKEDGCPEGERYCAAISARHKVYLFGRYEKNVKDMKSWHIDVHIFNTVSLGWEKMPPVTPGGEHHHKIPSRRLGHTAVLIEDTVFIWGGYWRARRGRYYDELFAFDVDAHRWFRPRVSGEVPQGRRNHSACVLEKIMFIYGGSTKQTTYTDDIYKLDTSTMVWSSINSRGTPPPPSERYSATIIGMKMFVFGGWGESNYDSITVFDTETNCWLNTPARLLLELACCSAFTYNGELYICGGRDWNLYFRHLCKYNPETFSWKKVEPKGKGPTHCMCCCMVGDRIVFFKGHKPGDTPVYELYILDMSPSLKTLCKLAVIQYGLEQSGLPHNIRWELAAMTK